MNPQKNKVETGQSLEEIASFPDLNPGPILCIKFNGTVIQSNIAARDLFGHDLHGKNWTALCPAVTEVTWKKILGTTNVLPLEVSIGNKCYVFQHRMDPKTNLVFAFGTDITSQRVAENQMRHSEKMATLGTLAAGVAHELNNPAAATRRAAQQLHELLSKLQHIHEKLYAVEMSPAETEFMLRLTKRENENAIQKSKVNSLEASDQESLMEEWLEEYGIENAWEVAPSLVSIHMERNELIREISGLRKEVVLIIIQHMALMISIHQVMHEIYESSSRLSEIVMALKNYSFLGQAPIQEINLHDGIDNTLIILRNKIKKGITVHREYSPDLPAITAYGSELNQVWTNILDNAADALEGHGDITIRTRKENDFVVIEIEDNGPGIPENILPHIFDPFFTTKAPGKGTGLGLSTTHSIVTEKHKGRISVVSKPGSTIFTVHLPVHPPLH